MAKDNDSFGGGFYPEPPESETKCFVFTAKAICNVSGYVWAKNEEEALDLIEHNNYDDIDDTELIKIKYVEEIEEYE